VVGVEKMTGVTGIIASGCVQGNDGDGGVKAGGVFVGGVHGEGTSGISVVFGVGC
jgi:hypothetical protein